MHPIRRHLFFALIMIVNSLTLFSQGYHVRLYTEDDGLPNLTVNDIVQDPSGRLWFATRTSIACYDGFSWKTYSGREGVPDYNYFRLKADGSGNIWAVHFRAHNPVIYFNGTSWQSLPLPPEFSTRAGASTISSVVLYAFQGNTILALGTRNQGVFVWKDRQWLRLYQKTGLNNNTINSMALFNNLLYIATEGGLVHVDLRDPASIQKAAIKLPNMSTLGLAVDEGNGLWILGDTWLGRYQNGRFSQLVDHLSHHFFKLYRFVVMQPVSEHELLFGDPYGMFRFDSRKAVVEKIGCRNGLNEDGAFSIFQDREKNLWFAGSRGVCKVANLPFDNFYSRDGLLENEVSAILEQKSGRLVFGHNSGFTFYDGRRFKKYKLSDSYYFRNLPPRVMDLKQDSQGNIWAAVSYAGILSITPAGRITRFGAQEGNEIHGSTLWIDRDDTIFAAGSRGLFQLMGQRFVPVQGSGKYLPQVRKLYRGRDGILYLATSNSGLWAVDQSGWRHFPCRDNETANSVFSLYQDKNDRLWVGTMAGLYFKGTTTIEKYQKGDLILNRAVYSINETPDQNMWFGTDYGIFRWNGHRLVNYTVQHGLAGYETNRAANINDRNGNIWIGTAQGLSRFKKDFSRHLIPPPLAELSYFKISGKRYSPQEITIIKPWKRNLEIHFNGLSFIDEKRILFQCKLEGYESEWSTQSGSHTRMVNYQNLAPGTYRFHLRVKNALDVWSEEAISADIVIPRPFYSTWWFYLAALLALLVFLSFTVKYLAKRKYAKTLEQKVIQGSARLKASEERYHTLFQESKDAIFFTKRGGRLLDINEAGLELLGFASKDEIMAINFSKDVFMDMGQRKQFLKDINQKSFVKDYELTLKRKDQSAIFVEITATSIRNAEGEMIGFRGIVRDITERKLLEHQLEQATKMEAIGALAGGVAHDLNNILSGLINYPELLLMKMPEDTPLKKYIIPIKETGNKAATIVQDLLTLARRMVIITGPVDINKIVADALDTPFYKKILKFHPGVKFEIDLAKSIWPIQGSESQLVRILLNLCSNGAEASPGGGCISISTRNQELEKRILAYERIEPGAYAVLSITDSGQPLTSQQAARIFEPFFTKKVLGRSGTGLGMAVVWAIVREHGGHITLQSDKRRGNKIELFFPTTAIRGTARKKISRRSSKKGRKEKILVVDDAEEQRKLATEILERSGFHATAVASGEQAVEFIKANEVDLVWLDMMMDPGMDGLETYQQIIRHRPGQKAIIVSGYSETPRVKQALKLGVGAYVKKPYTMEKITEIIHNQLDKA